MKAGIKPGVSGAVTLLEVPGRFKPPGLITMAYIIGEKGNAIRIVLDFEEDDLANAFASLLSDRRHIQAKVTFDLG